MPRFKVKVSDWNKPYYVKSHPGEVFEAVKIVPCNCRCGLGYQTCPGYVQAPWMEKSECWGFGGELFLEVVTSVLRVSKQEPKPKRMLRPIDEEI